MELILNSGRCSPASSLLSPSSPPSSPHLDLPIVTNSLDGDRAPHEVLRVPGPQLNDGFGASHQAGDGALRLDELLLLVLAERRVTGGLLEAGGRRSLTGISAPPTPTLAWRSYAGISGAEQTHREDPAALTGWEKGSGDGMGERTSRRGESSRLLLPLPCKAACTPLALLLRGQEHVFFQKGKQENTADTKMNVPGGVRGCPYRTSSSPKPAHSVVWRRNHRSMLPFLKQRMKARENQWLEWEYDELRG